MKSVLMSINPKWCELIANGKKTIEVRKTKPKLETPFKCYIYCTQTPFFLYKSKATGKIILNALKYRNSVLRNNHYEFNGKVIGEFVCQVILNYECEFADDCYEEIASVCVDEDGDEMGFIEWSNDEDIPYENTFFYKTSRVGYEELKKYIGVGFGKFYGWHISNLVIYDKPKELNEFVVERYPCLAKLKRPPQSWFYVKGGD